MYNKQKRNIGIGILMVLAFALILVMVLQQKVSALEEYGNPLCIDSSKLCNHPFINGNSYVDIYCDIGDISECPVECNNVLVNGNMIGKCDYTPNECVEGYERCGKNDISDPQGDIYNCLNGKWILKEKCGNDKCVEQSYNYAYCDSQKYYCVSAIGCSSWVDTPQENCYKTMDECLNNVPYCCESNDGKYTYRKKNCNHNEKPFQWTGMTKNECESKNQNIDCDTCNEFAISTIFGQIFPDKKCKPKKILGTREVNIFGVDIPFPKVNYPQNTTTCFLDLLHYLIIPLIFILSLLFGSSFLNNFKKLQKNKNLLIFVNIILALLISYFVYLTYLTGIILFIIYLLIVSIKKK